MDAKKHDRIWLYIDKSTILGDEEGPKKAYNATFLGAFDTGVRALHNIFWCVTSSVSDVGK